MTDSFGARLRRRREEQGIALGAIAEQTKIKASLLEALERDDVSQWPSGIFRRAFIRAYAHAIGLDPDVIVREFLEVHPEPDELAAAASLIAASAAEGSQSNGPPPTRLRQMVGSAIGTLGRFRRSPPVQQPAGAGAPRRVEPAPLESLPAAELRHADLPIVWEADDDGAAAARAVPPARVADDLPGRRTPLVGLTASDEPVRGEPALELSALDEPALRDQPEFPARAGSPAVDRPREETRAREADVAPLPAEPVEPDPSAFEPDLLAVAQLCTEFGRVEDADSMRPLLEQAAQVLDAAGLIVWIWDAVAEQLRPALVHGYSERVVAQLPAVGADDDNATAAAFRSAQPCAIGASVHTCSALALPLLTPVGCAGVLAIELPPGRERSRAVRAAATIVAAMLAQLAGGAAAGSRPAATRMPAPPAARPRVQQATRLERA